MLVCSTGTSHVPASRRPAYSDMNVSYRLQLSLFFPCSHVTVLHADVGVGSSQQCVFTRHSTARWCGCWKQSAMCVHTSQYCTLMWVLEAVSNVCSHVTVLHADVGVGSSQWAIRVHSLLPCTLTWVLEKVIWVFEASQWAICVCSIQSCALTLVLEEVIWVLETGSRQCVFTRYSQSCSLTWVLEAASNARPFTCLSFSL